MNGLNKYLSLLYILISLNLFGQELPPIENYTPTEYIGEHQNWAISQSSSKSMFVANHSSLMEFNGNTWSKHKLNNSSIFRSVKVNGDRVYTGSYREFGFWEKDDTGALQYTSLSERIKLPLADDEEFWDILCVDNWVLFQSLDRIYLYDQKEDTFKIIKANTKKAKLHAVKNRVYFQKENDGLFTIENGVKVLVSNDSIIKEQIIIGIYEKGANLLVVTEDGHFYTYDFNTFQPWKNDIDSLNVKLYSSLKLKDKSYVLGSIANGFYHVSEGGKLIRNINKAKGLNNNTVLSLFQDIDDNLWLGLDNGLSVVNLYSPFKEYVDKLGTLGRVYTAINHNEYLYLGTNQGLFYRKYGTNKEFKLLKGTEGQVWSLQLLHGTLFCGHNNGTFVVTDNKVNLVSNFPGTWAVKPIKNRNDLVLQGNHNGLSVLEKKAGNWKLRNVINGFDISSRFFESDSLEVFVNHEQKGLYHIKLDEKFTKVLSIDNRLPLGHSSNLFSYKKNICYKTHEGIYVLNGGLDKISLEEDLTQIAFKNADAPISIVMPDSLSQKLWFFSNWGINFIAKNTLTGKLTKDNIPMSSSLKSNLGVAGFENISRISPKEYLIGSSNGYVTLDLDKVLTMEEDIKLSAVYFGDYRTSSTSAALNTHGQFSSSQNNLKFTYVVTTFDKYTEVLYQNRLKGLYDEWSEWSKSPEVDFKNLPFGDYEFSVRGLVGNQQTNMAAYKFTIHRPWYLSYLAVLLYALGFVLLFLGIHRLYKRYYKKKQEYLIRKNEKELDRRKLEEKEKIAQILNEKLKDEIDNKNRELAISTMSILKKNKFLSSIKGQLNTITEKKQTVKSVIDKIDQNINSEDDWKFFEDAFNNADKDFLKRIKTKHGGLTNNDLRLCAYLRLNLTSKEIAPLLNISVKSVEMKRYRLRKKFDLPHQDNLIDYILNF